jgi:hypothetical protein
MEINFRPEGLAAWIGSLPMDDHEKAADLMFEYTPDIPLWVQLPKFAAEGMVAQFSKGMPGLTRQKDKIFVDAEDERFDEAMLGFYEAYMAIEEGGEDISRSRFALHKDDAPGFFVFTRELDKGRCAPVAVKGQVTGPFTFATSLVEKNGRAVFYNDQIRDAAVKLIAMKARWQVSQLKKYNVPVILFLDEPGLAGFGSSAFISVSRQEIDTCFAEVIHAVHQEGGLAGVHVCANAEWPVILESEADIVSFNAYSYFDKFVLYADAIKDFLNKGKILARGIVPTGDADAIESETPESLYSLWQSQAARIEAMGFDMKQIISQSIITPSCGTGSLSLELAMKVIDMNRRVSELIRGQRQC